MKKKLIYCVDNTCKNYIATITNNSYTFKENPGLLTKITYFDNKLTIKKSGNLEVSFTHVVGETKQLEYTANLSGEKFYGSSRIKTTQIKKDNNKITLKYIRDGEHIMCSFEIIN